jgi:hypothetical protein
LIFAYKRAFNQSRFRPYLTIVLRNGFATTPQLIALVDSGADYSIFPAALAEYLKLDLTGAPIWRFNGTTGQIQEARLAELSLAVLAKDESIAFEISTVCAFCETFNFGGGVLLGQDGFFSRFKTTFCQAENYFEIEAV